MPKSAVRLVVALLVLLFGAGAGAQRQAPVQFIFTSDVHYGITRPEFRGARDVDATVVNAAQVASMNALPATSYPKDGGLRAGETVGAITFVAEGGDIANRQEGTPGNAIQPAATSWAQFTRDYVEGLTVRDAAGERAPLFMVPGNHDVSNAVGFHRPMTPATDSTSYVSIYNWMLRPSVPLTPATFDPARHRVMTSRDIGGVHLQFIPIWPDSDVRRWMAADLQRVSATTPVIVFAHDPPDVEAKHLRNPNGAHDVNPRDRFENVTVDMPAAGTTIDDEPVAEHAALEGFLTAHPNVTAYFHGHTNFTQFYAWSGPTHTAALHVFRADSPMKGELSARDETKLAYEIAVLDPVSKMLTVREVLWNATKGADAPAVRWGMSTTVALQPRPTMAAAATR